SVTPPAFPMLRTNGRFEIHSRISPAGMFSSLIRPSSVRTRIHVNSDVRATSRYDEATPVTAVGAAAAGAGGVGADTAGVGAGGRPAGSAARHGPPHSRRALRQGAREAPGNRRG